MTSSELDTAAGFVLDLLLVRRCLDLASLVCDEAMMNWRVGVSVVALMCLDLASVLPTMTFDFVGVSVGVSTFVSLGEERTGASPPSASIFCSFFSNLIFALSLVMSSGERRAGAGLAALLGDRAAIRPDVEAKGREVKGFGVEALSMELCR